jgi:uncharacterized protein with HEPN domain
MSAQLDEGLIDVLLSLEGWCERALRVTAGQTREGFLSSELLQLATSMAVSQTGEVCGRILKKWPMFAEAHPELELGPANAMRHRLIHVYEQTDLLTLWDTVQVSVPAMLDAIRLVLSESGLIEP